MFKTGQKVYVITNRFSEKHLILYEGKYVQNEPNNDFRIIIDFGETIGKHCFNEGQVFSTPEGALNQYNEVLDEVEQRITETRQDLKQIKKGIETKKRKKKDE